MNTVNTVGVMGKGIAKTFKEVYPEMFSEYQILCEKKLLTIGKLWIYKTPNKWVLNFPTKKHWRSPSKIEYIEAGLKKFVQSYDQKGIDSIAFPPLGCGNGGLNWENEVKPLMEKYLNDLPIEVFIHLPTNDLKNNKREHNEIRNVKKWLWSQPAELSFFEVWEDLIQYLANNSSIHANKINYGLSLIEKENTFVISFSNNDINIELSKEQVNEIWDFLRNNGVITAKTLPNHLNKSSNIIFNLFNKLPYIEPIEVARSSSTNQANFEMGIRLVPVSNDENFQGEMMI
ncbi:macro domain-containing protein [Rossellomorea marisflavi]|uniref:macro domain-containing protein n=1 Tax=Rossellomorea marisflavi TaxID=189381 RepID=UPI001652FF03|nr:macro domain-containing protein [Rossellomorea marisflavi]